MFDKVFPLWDKCCVKPKDKTVFVRMDAALKGRIDAEASRRGESVGVIVREALRRYFESKPDPKAALVVPTSGLDAANRLNEPVQPYKP